MTPGAASRSLAEGDRLNIEITNNMENALFSRKDITFVLHHQGAQTPSRVELRQLLAAEVGTKTENVVVDGMTSTTGLAVTRGVARVYASADAARKVERAHLLKRNNLFQEKKKEE